MIAVYHFYNHEKDSTTALCAYKPLDNHLLISCIKQQILRFYFVFVWKTYSTSSR